MQNHPTRDKREALRSTLVTSQVPVHRWHPVIGAPTLADAILDCLVHLAYRFSLKGDPLRNKSKKAALETDKSLPSLKAKTPSPLLVRTRYLLHSCLA